MWNHYYLAATLSDALGYLNQYPDDSMVISGGTDLVLELKRGQHNDRTRVVDISRLNGLDKIYTDTAGALHIGALVTHNQVTSSAIIRSNARCLAEASFQVGSPQIRNRGTVAGNLITASPANDTIPALIVLGAELVLVSPNSENRVKLEDFYLGVRKTILGKNEILKEIVLNPEAGTYNSTFYKFALRNAQAISVANAAVALKTYKGNVVDARIAVGAVAPTVVRLRSIESQVTGLSLEQLENFQLPEKIAEISPISDIRGSATFRREMIRVIVKRCIDTLLFPEKAGQKIPENPITLSDFEKHPHKVGLTRSIEIDNETPIQTTIDNQEYTFRNAHQKTLLDLIRENAGLTGSKEGCAEGECGACTVYLGGKAVMACLVPAPRAHLAEITTIEGIAKENQLHPIQQAFIEEGAVQCGYCTPGFIMSAVKLLDVQPHPSESEIKAGLTGNLGRCTGYYKIIKAIEKASSSGGDHA